MNQIEAQRLKALIDQLTVAEPFVPNFAPNYPEPPRAWVCPIHGVSKIVPAGFSQRTQKPYNAFVACPAQGCNQRPPRENGAQGATATPYAPRVEGAVPEPTELP